MRATALLLVTLCVGPLALGANGCKGVPPEHAAHDTNPPIFVGDGIEEVRKKWGNPDAIEAVSDKPTSTDITTWRYDVHRGVGTETVSSFVRFRDGAVIAVDQMDASARRPDLIPPDTTRRHDGF